MPPTPQNSAPHLLLYLPCRVSAPRFSNTESLSLVISGHLRLAIRLETSSPLAMDQIFGFVEPFLQEPTLLVAQSIIQHFVMIACRQLQILHFTDAVPPVLTCNYAVTPVFTTPLQNEEHVSSPMPVVDPFWLDLGGWRRVLYPVWRLQAHLYSRALHLAFTPISSRPPQLWSG